MIPNTRVLAMKIKKASPQDVEKILKRVYLYGFADGSDAEVVNDIDRFIRVRTDTVYQCECPECNTVMELDLLDLLKRNGEE